LFVNLSGPKFIESDEQKPIYGKTYHITLKVRDQKYPNDVTKFMNMTTALSIMIHELAHVKH